MFLNTNLVAGYRTVAPLRQGHLEKAILPCKVARSTNAFAETAKQ